MSLGGRKQQHDARGYPDEWMDQHGRKFGAHYELESNRPIGELQPIGFSPPWLPPMRYISWEKKTGFRFRWNYDVIADEWSSLTAAYYEEAAKYAMDHNIPAPEHVGGPLDYRLRAALGKPPLSPAIPLACKLGNPWMLGVPGAPVDVTMKEILSQSVNANGREVLDKILVKLSADQAVSEIVPVPTLDFQTDIDKAPSRGRSIVDVTYDPSKITYAEFSKDAFAKGMKQVEVVLAWKEHQSLLAGV
jgi:hypothetical protein